MDPAALREQLEQHHAACYGWAKSCCRGRAADAEDVLQTAYLKILQGRARFDGRSSFRPWLFGVIRRTALDERRRNWLRRLRLERLAREPVTEPEPSRNPADRTEPSDRLGNILARLPRRQQEVLHLSFYQDLSLREASAVMGVSVGSARRHYERGKARLRQWLETETTTPGERWE